ncbi:efflux transporter, outer membrane factor (OMF) lipoprotein, NodT family [Lishizhenia tianjinensis]|uniref:Efflux transporter, outer membrane factor (OMF) lipoprotein, NodT family n=1 Tax=Lishizhenia tianjinensis TaxID=477690 RepID=A0A1I6YUD7_9FLAO|nr:TolC family protein [Lishizhenia tianjinensis]SFT54103.1 efflux transporter, outer membrane factor (OMF) lipoprotein, NodT family [Lishizhenia tianjinensis]
MLVGISLVALPLGACKTPTLVEKELREDLPQEFAMSKDTLNSGTMNWKEYFTDPYLNALIDTALQNNQELNIILQEIQMANNEVSAKKGEYLPSVSLGVGAAGEKVGRYTVQGASEATTDIKPGRETPEVVPDFMVGGFMNWEVDIWHKLRNAKKAQVMRYLSSIEGKNFMVTHLIAEIADAYYELMALDNQLTLIQQNIAIQSDALEVVRLQKKAARVTELAVRRFEAQVMKTKSLQYDVQQQIIEKENEINYLLGRYPQPIARNSVNFNTLVPDTIHAGIPSQLMANRPDIRQAELELEAANLDVKVARANFYPSLTLRAGLGLQSFNPAYLISTPESMLFNLIGDASAPLINRKAIAATYKNANAKQIQAIYKYEQTVLKAYLQVVNQLSSLHNLEMSYALQANRVDALTQSIQISNDLFKSARADYMEVLLTQRDALESKFELIETKKNQLHAFVQIYKALGGGWN